jgi:hypothetical protein
MFWFEFWSIILTLSIISFFILVILFIIFYVFSKNKGAIVLFFPILIAIILGITGVSPILRDENRPRVNLDNPLLYSENNIIKWNSIENASKYRVKVNNTQEFDKAIGLEEINTDNGSLFIPGFNTVEITAVAMNRFFIDSSTSENFYKLPSITGLNYDPETQLLTWDPIEINLIPNIEYEITIDFPSEQLTTVETINRLNLTDYETGVLSASIKATSNIDFVLDSKATVYNFSHQFDVRYEDDFLRWDALPGATAYRVYADNQYIELGSNVTSHNVKNWNLFTPGIKQLEVRPMSGTQEFNTRIFTVGKPGPITQLQYDLDTNLIVWSSSTSTEKFDVYVNGAFKESRLPNNRTYLLNENPGLYEISVKPIIESVSSVSSDFKTIYVVHDVQPELIGSSLTWDSIQGATYRIHITGRENPISVNTNSYDLNLANLPSGESEVRVEVVKVGTLIDYPFSASKLVYKANPVNAITYNNGLVTWTASSNATDYLVRVNGNEIVGPHDTRSVDLSSYSVGLYTISVTPVLPNGLPQVAKMMRIVHGLNLSLNNDIFSWDVIPNVTYSLVINGNDVQLPSNTQSSIAFSALNLLTGTNNIKVRVTDNVGIIDYPFSNEISAVKLGAVTNVTYNGTQVNWDAVANVNQYEIFVNDISQGFVSTTHYDVSNQTVGFYKLDILPVGSLPNSLTGLKSSIAYLHGFTIAYNEGILSWANISNATYTLIYDESNTRLSLSQNTTLDLRTLTTLPAGAHNFKIEVTIQGETNIQSPYSNTITLTKLASVANLTYGSGKFSWTSSETDVSFQVNLNGTLQSTSANEFTTSLLLGDNPISIVTTKAGLFLSSEPVTTSISTSRLATPTISITRHPTITSIWFINVPLVPNSSRVEVVIRYYTHQTITTETYNSDGANKFISSLNFVKIEVEAIAFAPAGSLYFDSLTANNQRTF